MKRIPFVLALAALPLVAAPTESPNPAAAPITAPQPAAADQRVDQIMAKMTLEQKIDLLGGVDDFFVRGYPELGLPRLRMADGPVGVRNFGPSTAYAAGIGLAASWDPALARQIGASIGRDARAKGVHFMLGPGVNVYRAPMNGRNFEYFGEDPYLAARTTAGYVQGVQSQGVVATVKHYAGNNSEFDRHDSNTQVDERTLREIYLPAFEAAVKEGKVGAIMDAYNLVNGEHATQNGHLNNEIAKQEWGFRGIIMSDWDATYDAVGAANGGLDLEMPRGKFLNRENLLPAIKDGRVSLATIDDKVRRIIRTAVEFGFLDREQKDVSIPRYNEESRQVALQGALEGAVLLKNAGVLPLDRQAVKTIAVIGPAAYPAVPVGGGSAAVQPFNSVSGLEGVAAVAGPGVKVLYDRGVLTREEIGERCQFLAAPGAAGPGATAEFFATADFSGPVVKTTSSPRIAFYSDEPVDWSNPAARKQTSVRYTASYVPKKSSAFHCFVGASGQDTYRLLIDGKLVREQKKSEGQTAVALPLRLEAGKACSVVFELVVGPSWGPNRAGVALIADDELITPEATKLAASADAAVVMVGFDNGTECESFDRTFELPGGQDALIQAVAAANPKTVVALVAGGAVDAAAWIEKTPALLHTWYAGQEGGRALGMLLFGDANPSGHLPISWERAWSDNPVHDSYYYNNGDRNIRYTEGIFVGYRGYEKNGVQPLFPFGHGLSYTSFAYKNLKVSPVTPKLGEEVTVSFDVTNTGQRAGTDVPQLYLGNPTASVARPAKELKGFERVTLKAGETKRVVLTLDARAMSFYDVAGQGWKQEPGTFTVAVGHSSADLALKGEYEVVK